MEQGTDIYRINDNCRKNLVKYTLMAFSCVPPMDNPSILDLGCGTGVPSLALLEQYCGTLCAVDSDALCLLWLKEKAAARHISHRIRTIHSSVFDLDLLDEKFDIVMAEGLLNVTGFEQGLAHCVSYVKQNGYILIHDELRGDAKKRVMFEKYNLKLINTFKLDERVWLDEYYRCLEKAMESTDKNRAYEMLKKEVLEAKKDFRNLRSIYYILHYA